MKKFHIGFHGVAPARLALIAMAALTSSAHAVEIDTDIPDLSIRFDNTLGASTMYRLKNASPSLVDSFRLLVPGMPASALPQALNFNAGDDNFRNKGFVSERVDLFSEFDVVYQHGFGFRMSAAAWYDAAYHRHSDATDATNGQSPVNAFPNHTRVIAGGNGEVLDAFVFGGWTLGDDGQKLTARLGSHALQYGESLFFGDNGIARAQGPIDIAKLAASPNAQFKEVIRPVPQLSGQLQLSPDLSIGGYYQFAWSADRLPPAGSYFSVSNIPWGSGQSEFYTIPAGPIAGTYVLNPAHDVRGADTGQFGAQLKWRVAESDVGFYAARYNDKDGQLYGSLNLANPFASSWNFAFPNGIKVYGASVSHSFGDFNFAMEGSVRDNMPLRSTNMIYVGVALQYATGKTAHLNLSTLASFGPSFLSQESTFLAEVAWNSVLKKNDPAGQLDAGVTRGASIVQAVFSPTYRQVLPGLDLNVPIGARYSINGNSSVTTWNAKGAGDATLGLSGTYLGVWQFATTYTHYMGKPVPFIDYSGLATGGTAIYGKGNDLADRDNISISIRRTF